MNEHTVTLVYTIDDDGIWMQCSCGWDCNIGIDPTLQQANAEYDKHRRTAGTS